MLESVERPYSPGDGPWTITAASPETERRIAEIAAGCGPVPGRFQGLLAAYYQALATGASLPLTLGDARQSIEFAAALYHSAATGLPVRLPIVRDHPAYRGWRPVTG